MRYSAPCATTHSPGPSARVEHAEHQTEQSDATESQRISQQPDTQSGQTRVSEQLGLAVKTGTEQPAFPAVLCITHV